MSSIVICVMQQAVILCVRTTVHLFEIVEFYNTIINVVFFVFSI